MADKTVQLGITADASGVETGVGRAKQSLKSLGAAAKQAGKEASQGLDQVGDGAAAPAQKIDAATRSILNQVQRTSAALAAGGRNTREYYETLANQRGANLDVLKPYLAQLDAVTAAQKRVNASAVDLDKVGTSRGATNFSRSLEGVGTSPGASAFGQTQKDLAGVQNDAKKAGAAVGGLNQQLSATGLTAKQTTAALRQVPAQFTDIVVSLQSGQNPLTVLLQQGGQLKDVFGGAGAAAQALGRYMLGLVTPLTVVGAAAAAVAYGFITGSREAQEFNKTLILTGNQIGLTVGQLTAMSARLDELGGTQARAAEVLGAFAGSSKIAAQDVERFAAAAIALERVGGPAAEETAKAFAELGKAPVQASIKLNEATGFLTRSVYEQIKALEEQGRTTEAARVAQDAYANAIESRAPQIVSQLGLVERAWKGIKDGAAGALDAIKNFGRVEGIEGQIATLEAASKRLRAAGKNQAVAGFRETLRDTFGGVSFEQQAVKVDKVVARLRESLELERGIATLNAKAQESTRAKIEFDKQGEEFLSKQAKAAREIAQARELGAKAGLKQEEIDKRVAAIRDKFADKPKGGKTGELKGLEVDLNAIERDLRTLTGAYANAENILAAQRQVGLVSEQDYYEARRAFIRINTDAQVEALRAENAAIEASVASGKLKADEKTRQAEKVKDNLSKIQEIEAKAAAQTAILGIQQTSAINSVSRAYKEAQQSAQDYLDTLQRNQRRELELMGMSDAARQRSEGRQRIEDQYAAERRRVENERNLLSLQQGGNLTSDQQKRFDDLLAINEDFQAKALASYEQYTKDRIALEVDWSVGAQRAVAQYLEEAQNIARQTEDAFANAFRGMEDALVDFIRTGKLDFKSLADSIVADIARIIVKQQLSKAIGLVGEAGASSSGEGGWGAAAAQFFGSLFGGGRAIGGPVQAGGLYRVNERGPELLKVAGEQYLMMGSQGGEVQAAPRQSAPAQVLTVNVQMPQGANRQTAQQFGVEIGRQLQLATTRNG